MSQQTKSKNEIDAVTFEVHRSGYEYTADPMNTVLQRTLFSPIMYEMVDFSNGHCLVLHLLDWHVSIESLMRSLVVVVMHELFKPLADARPTAHP
ncbi:hypothetical protein C481_20876 [Natrialba asiatica DSM 12278]|uniref:Uncharacterized protein n=1 Tax=Natrialba asiatica (strain ATCC 700177 / DSM 12278 / JCM 9576 / FERM P-10747 / NBRC 102637 / 172P1) TaxID=29540 RepID=M0AEY7_NATA1|nr:hypothetical protein C481_20876 [Natrialba asiatica DSM 12278]